MDFTFTEEQQAAAEAARGVFAGVAPDTVPSPSLLSGAVAEDFDRALWAKLAEADLLSLLLNPEYGGAGLDVIALCLVLRESAKGLARVPLLENSAALAAVQAHGSEELRSALLERAGRGELVLTVAANGRSGHDGAELAVTARQDGEDWLLDGVQTAVPWAHNADFVLVPARSASDRTLLAVVPRVHEGIVLAEQISTTGERLGELRLESARIAADQVVEAEGAWEWLREPLTTGTCALALGLGLAVALFSAAAAAAWGASASSEVVERWAWAFSSSARAAAARCSRRTSSRRTTCAAGSTTGRRRSSRSSAGTSRARRRPRPRPW